MDKSNSLVVSEFFHSIQGEGPTTGYPAWFLRLTGCNLDCPWCDTTEVWRKGDRMEFEQIPAHYGYTPGQFLNNLNRGDHFIITGGEPMLQQESLICYFRLYGFNIPIIEIETNGTITPHNDIRRYIKQWNISPKLSNSGQAREKRYKPEVLDQLNSPNSVFKFVIEDETDIQEIQMDYIDPGLIDRDKIWLMPMADNRQELEDRSIWVAEICKKQGFKFSNRLQIQVWNKTTGV